MAIKIGMKAVHPGGFIKRSVLPDDLSITAAAEALGMPAILREDGAGLRDALAARGLLPA